MPRLLKVIAINKPKIMLMRLILDCPRKVADDVFIIHLLEITYLVRWVLVQQACIGRYKWLKLPGLSISIRENIAAIDIDIPAEFWDSMKDVGFLRSNYPYMRMS